MWHWAPGLLFARAATIPATTRATTATTAAARRTTVAKLATDCAQAVLRRFSRSPQHSVHLLTSKTRAVEWCSAGFLDESKHWAVNTVPLSSGGWCFWWSGFSELDTKPKVWYRVKLKPVLPCTCGVTTWQWVGHAQRLRLRVSDSCRY